ncbi:MAG: hypothetical protein L6Q76_09015 [Polyangiaceae bacterium]|nr:hypothetical protein [Polyangiaceae bacterium]
MRPHEFDRIVDIWRSKLGFHVFVEAIDHIVVCNDSLSYYSDLPFFLGERIPAQLPAVNDVRPGELGWISATAPQEKGKVLLMGNVGSKSTWYDPATKSGWRNDDVHALFRKAVNPLRKCLKYPVWGRNVIYSTPWEACRDIGYSPGVVEWEAGGGELRQDGVKNILYTVSPNLQPKKT